MRPTFALLLVVGACGDAPCDIEACGAGCQALGFAVGMPDDTRILDARIAALVRSELDDLRRGAQLRVESSGLCTGTTGCDVPLGTAPGPLAPGTYHVHLDYRLPKRALPGFWQVKVYESCVAGPTRESLVDAREQLREEVWPLTDPQGSVDALQVDVGGGDAWIRACAWRAFLVATGSEPVPIEGRWRFEPAAAAVPAPGGGEAPAEDAAPGEPPAPGEGAPDTDAG